MPNFPTKVRVIRWSTGEDGGEVYQYDSVRDGYYQEGSPEPLTHVPLRKGSAVGQWITSLGTTLLDISEQARIVGNSPTQATLDTGPTAFKADTGKSRWTLLLDCVNGCGRAVRAVVRVLNFAVRPIAEGGKGYIPHSWRQVPAARQRYEDALHRHLDAIRDGETHDAESGESHWAHVATNALFLWELDNPRSCHGRVL